MGLISNGTTIFDNGAMASGFGGSMVFISSATASSSASIEFTLGDYKEYKFFFVNMHPATDDAEFEFQGSTDSGSSYGVTMTTTNFQAAHNEDGSGSNLSYINSGDLAQSTNFQRIARGIGSDNDQAGSGFLQLFNPSSTTFVKHFIIDFSELKATDGNRRIFTAGYFNTTSALTNIKFQMSSGNIDAGTIYMFGIN